MAIYTPTVGIITNIDAAQRNYSIFFDLQSEDQGPVRILLPANAYVLNLHPFQVGDRATFFYPNGAPAPLIYPPQYTTAVAAYTPHGVTATLDVFDNNFINNDHTLILTPSMTTPVTLPNGQSFTGDTSGNLILATYTNTTRSIPARAIPEQMVVFPTM
ncbi:MAG: hypothetical protein IJO55_05040 [Lachnospiraceae bacterium]|nr:hypothetical protein [Lachnospiraceae bacterium]